MLEGRIFQINLSNGGVPKQARHEAEVTEVGVVGDRQIHTEVHGGPERALCLYSLERIQELQSEGNPVFPGAMGENLTVSGLDWSQMQPGLRLQLGNEVLAEITSFTTPCSSLSSFFRGGNFGRVSQKRFPGWSRVYARVLKGGAVNVADVVKIV